MTSRGSNRDPRDGLQVQVYAGRDPLTGRKRYVSQQVAGQTKASMRQAKQIEGQLLGEIGTGQHKGSRSRTMAELLARWLEWRPTVRPIAPTTVSSYRTAMDRYILPAIGKLPVRQADAATLDAFYAHLPPARPGQRARHPAARGRPRPGPCPQDRRHQPPGPLPQPPLHHPRRELGLDVGHVQPIGWSATSVPEPTATRYGEVLAELAAALVLWRRAELASPAGSGRSRNALACSCACGRRIRVARSVLELARSCALPARATVPSQRTTRNIDAYASTTGTLGALRGRPQPQ
jgi:hypothetical protein